MTTNSSITVSPGFGRIPVGQIEPVIENGAYPAKATLNEAIPITARVIREGHDKVGAHVILTDPQGNTRRADMKQIWPEGLDIWQVWVRLDKIGDWTFRVEGYADDWHTWQHNAQIKFSINQDSALVCLEAKPIFEQAAKNAQAAGDPQAAKKITDALNQIVPTKDGTMLADLISHTNLDKVMSNYSQRALLTPSVDYPIYVERERALYGSWYEFFPRSQGAYQDETGKWHSGNFAQCHQILERIASLGFDVVYIPPIHPIGQAFKKGRDNSLNAHPDDPGSCWAIGSSAGGHDAIHPDLGTIADFDRFVAKAKSLNLEIALDFALQVSPDHPWVHEHPQWFTIRPDGTIAYAENPPKKYQDIYPINFDNDPEGIFTEVVRLINFWIDHGVTIFRVDNPHTKPLNFWDRLLSAVKKDHPEIIFLAEAFSRPVVMGNLGKVGFQQSYTYFTWRTSKKELGQYLTELSTQTDSYMRPNFFVNTPDINPLQVRSGKPAAFSLRMVLAATMSPSWGIYSGYELFEFEPPHPDEETYLHSEKYEYRPRDYDAQPNLNGLMAKLNDIRRRHPALQQLRQVRLLQTTNDDLFAFIKTDGDDQVIVVVTLNPEGACGEVIIDEKALDLGPNELLGVYDEMTGKHFIWNQRNYVSLDSANTAHILAVQRAVN